MYRVQSVGKSRKKDNGGDDSDSGWSDGDNDPPPRPPPSVTPAASVAPPHANLKAAVSITRVVYSTVIFIIFT